MKKKMMATTRRESGIVLIAALLLVLTLVGITGYVLVFSVAGARSVEESVDQQTAFYLAEAGLETAKWELGELVDPDGDGIGSKTVYYEDGGSYTVLATDLGAGNYELTSTGARGGSQVSLQVTINHRVSSAFPQGALSIVGGFDSLDLEFEDDNDLILDGGNGPALTFSDQTMYDQISLQLANGISEGDLPSANITGSPMTTFLDSGGSTVDLPIVLQTEYNSELQDLTSLYTQLVAKGNELKTTAAPAFSDPDEGLNPLRSTYGSPGSPVSVYVNGFSSTTNKTIVGHGTLVVGAAGLQLGSGVDMTWNGDIFILGDSANDAVLKVKNGANLVVNGNLIVLGEGFADTKVSLDSGTATVNGSFFIGTDWSDPGDTTQSSLEINDASALTVNGLLTMVGPSVDLEFEVETDIPNPLNAITVTGGMQMAVPPTSTKASKLGMELEGDSAIYKDDAMLHEGLEALQSLGVDYSMPMVDVLIDDGGFTTFSWQRLTH